MGMIGDLLYPNNASEARKLNEEQQQLQQINALHNALVTSYREMADQIREFDSYLMAILVMQYHMVYAKEDLANLPATSMPQLTQSIADKIEQVALEGVSIKMGINGIKAIGRRVANLLQEGGSFKASTQEADVGKAFEEDIAPELDSTSMQADLVRSGNVEVLTQTEVDASEMQGIADELTSATRDLGEASEADELDAKLTETLDTAEAGSEAATEASEAASEASEAAAEASAELGVEAGAEAAAEGGASILGPAVVIIIVVTEIIGIFQAKATHEKLEKALALMKKLTAASNKSLATTKKAYKSLLKCAQLDIAAYNRLLKRLYQLEGNAIYNTQFNDDAFATFSQAIEGLTYETRQNIAGYQQACLTQLNTAMTQIRQQAEHDSPMTVIISEIKTHLRAKQATTADATFLKDVAAVNGVSLEEVKTFDHFRQIAQEIASTLAPFHRQIQQGTASGKKTPTLPSSPQFGQPDPNYQPNPNHFTVP